MFAVAGDVMEPGLGLSEADKQRLAAQVTIVFHSAATVKFNEKLQHAVRLNTMGTQSVIELCKDMVKLQVSTKLVDLQVPGSKKQIDSMGLERANPNIPIPIQILHNLYLNIINKKRKCWGNLFQAVVHVSTAYSNANRTHVDEKVYPPPASPIGVVECVKHLSPDLVEHLGAAIVAKDHPNTYTVTKAMAESLVSEEAENLPISIVRPSIGEQRGSFSCGYT